MERYFHILLFLLTIVYRPVVAQKDSTTQSAYFLEQSAIVSKKGTLVYNNYYVLINSVSYTIIDGLKVSAGALIVNQRPPFFAHVQYSFPIAPQLYIGGSLGYYQLDYDEYRSNYIIVPQVLVTTGNQQINTTFNTGIVRGRFLFGGGFLTPSVVNLPSRVNWVLGLSHRRPLYKDLSLITQNTYVSAQAPANSRYSELLVLSLGAAWQLERKHTLKVGLSAIYYPKEGTIKPSSFIPFLGYSLSIK